MDLLGDLLANGKTSRLYRTLVYERRVALDVSAYQSSRELGGFFLLVATAAPGQSLDGDRDAHRHRTAGLGRVGTHAKARWSAPAPRSKRTSSTGFRPSAGSEASPISSTPTTSCAAIRDSSTRTWRATATPRPETVRETARRVLGFDRRVLLSVVPRGQQHLALAGRRTGLGLMTRADRSRLPDIGPDPAVHLSTHRPSSPGQRPAGPHRRTSHHAGRHTGRPG